MDSWSKGDYSQLIREASMVVEKLPVVILPSGRVPGRVLLVLPILEAYEHKYKRGRSNILLKHNLNIISQSIGSQQTHHSNSIRITYVPRSCRAAHED